MTQPGAAAMVASSMRPMRPAAPTTPILVAMVPAFRPIMTVRCCWTGI
jgi:hypothetical protein